MLQNEAASMRLYFGRYCTFVPPPFPIVIDDSLWKNAAESFTVALTLTLGGYESAIAPYFVILATLKGILYSILL